MTHVDLWQQYRSLPLGSDAATAVYWRWRAAVAAYVAALPDDGGGDDIGDPDDEGDAYPRSGGVKVVAHAA